MKRIGLFIFFVMISLAIAAQQKDREGIKMSAGASFLIPVYNMSLNSVGTGIDVIALYHLQEKLALTADAGLSVFFSRFDNPPTTLVPLRAGIRYYAGDKYFIAGKTGIGIYMLNAPRPVGTIKDTYAAFSIAGGYHISKQFEAGVAWDLYAKKDVSFAYIGLRAGYSF